MREKAKDALMELGANPAIKGFRYTVEALVLLDENPVWLDKTIALYKEVATIGDVGATGSRVERAIRHMVEGISLNSSLAAFHKYLPSNIDGKLTNSMFLASLYYKLQEKEGSKISEGNQISTNGLATLNSVNLCSICTSMNDLINVRGHKICKKCVLEAINIIVNSSGV